MSEPVTLDDYSKGKAAFVMDGVLYNDDAVVAAWVQEKFGQPLLAVPFRALGVISDEEGKIIAGAYFVNQYKNDITICVASAHPAAGRPEVVHRIFDYPFGRLNIPRITAEIDASNQTMLDVAYKLGFQLEGKKRKAAEDGGDRLILGLLRDDALMLGVWKPDDTSIKFAA